MQFNQEAVLLITVLLILTFTGGYHIFTLIFNYSRKEKALLKIDKEEKERKELEKVAEESVVDSTIPEESIKEVIQEPIIDLAVVEATWKKGSVLKRIGPFQIFETEEYKYQWRLTDGDTTILLQGNSEFISETTCEKGVESVIRVIRNISNRPAFRILNDKPDTFIVVLKSGNGKIIAKGEPLVSSEKAEDVAMRAFSLIKNTVTTISNITPKSTIKKP